MLLDIHPGLPPAARRRQNALRLGRATILAMIALGTVVAATAIWVRSQGIPAFRTYDGGLGSLGLLTGLLASDLVIIQVLLIARIPWVETAWGHDVLLRYHRWVGFASFWFMIAHVYTYTVLRVEGARGALSDRLWQLFVTNPWMLFATIGTIMLIAVVVSSIRNARRRLRYESWHFLHLYAYLGMAFAFPHQLFDGRIFHGTWSRFFWWGIYILAAAAIVIFRLGLPLWRSWYHQLRVSNVRSEAPGIVSIAMSGQRLDRLDVRSGQFFIWRFLSGGGLGWATGHPYTLSAAPTDDHLRITIQDAGDWSHRVARLREGTRVLIEGPYGVMTADRRRHRRLLCIAAGVGITPMRALLADADYAPGDATLIYRVGSPDQTIFHDELDAIATARGVDVIYVSGPRASQSSWLPAGPDGWDQDGVAVLRELIPDVADRDVFICGPSGWMSLVRKSLRQAGVARRDIHTENFSW
ncbi:MAG TPA: ferredoxin reductase family protein [Thermomicrobiales bacterium]|nr:ferredoxin reductase family protein [Thermomicrobiales bacterium]